MKDRIGNREVKMGGTRVKPNPMASGWKGPSKQDTRSCIHVQSGATKEVTCALD